jgi:hypothetical protein
VARAKKTDRSEARRRTRLAAPGPELDEEEAGGGPAAPATGAAPANAGRPSILGAFRQAIRPIDLRGDLRQIPWLVTKTHSVWLPSVLIVAATVWFSTSNGSLRDLPGLAFNLFVFPPPLAAAFMAGILTERMSYLAGGLVGLVSAIVFSAYMLVGPVPGSPSLTEREGYVLYAFAISPLSGLAIGGFAGFYRRFLRRANPGRAAQQQARGKGTKAPARR